MAALHMGHEAEGTHDIGTGREKGAVGQAAGNGCRAAGRVKDTAGFGEDVGA